MILCFLLFPFQLLLSLSFISSCPCAVSLLCSLICGLSLILCLFLSLFFFSRSLSLGMRMKTKPILFFSSEGAEYFSFAFSLFLCAPSFFPGPFDVSVDSLSFRLDELTDTDARALACTCAHTPRVHTLSLCLFILQTRGVQREASVYSSVFVSLFQCAAPPTLLPIQFLNALLTWKENLHK